MGFSGRSFHSTNKRRSERIRLIEPKEGRFVVDFVEWVGFAIAGNCLLDESGLVVEQIEQQGSLFWFSNVHVGQVHVDSVGIGTIVECLLDTDGQEDPEVRLRLGGVELVKEDSLEFNIVASSSSIVRRTSSGIYTSSAENISYIIKIIKFILHL